MSGILAGRGRLRIGFVHTRASLIARVEDEMAAALPHADRFHMLNESLLQDLLRGVERGVVYRRVVQQTLLAVDSGADLLVVTCSSVSPAVDVVRQLCTVPVLKIDDPMAAEAVRAGRRIAVLCTNTSAPGPIAALLRQHAAVQGREVLVETVVRPEAATALFADDGIRHDSIVTEAAQQAAKRADLLVLGDAELGHLQAPLQGLGKPVYASLSLLMAELTRRLAAQQSRV